MWKKDEEPEPMMASRPEMPPMPERMAPPAPQRSMGERATIGRSISIKGEVTGDEDLLIQGRVDGSVDLKQNSVTIGREGEVKANISGRVITVEGRVEGNLKAEEQVVLRSSAVVQGDITSPRVVLEDGARFRGGIDMGDINQTGVSARATGRSAQSSRSSSGIDLTPRLEATSPADDKLAAGKSDGTAVKAVEATT